MNTPKLLIVDDHPLFRAALVQALGTVLPGAQRWRADGFGQVRPAVMFGQGADGFSLLGSNEDDLRAGLPDAGQPGKHVRAVQFAHFEVEQEQFRGVIRVRRVQGFDRAA